MKIGIDIRTLAEGKVTGVEVYTVNLLKKIFEIDRYNHYVLFYNSYGQIATHPPDFDYPNVTLKRFAIPNRLLNTTLLALGFPKIDRLLGGLDIFFTPRYLFSALSTKCRLVVTVHDLSFVRHPEFFSARQRLWHKLISDRSVCRKAAAVISVSESTKKDLINLFRVPSEKIHVIYPGVDCAVYHSGTAQKTDEQVKKIYELNREFILFLGTVEPRKNVLGVIDAYEQLRKGGVAGDIELVVAGKLGWLYKDVLKKIRDSRYNRAIKLLDSVPDEYKPSLYRLAKIFLFPSFFEGFGFPPLEALACGTPVVASYNTSFPEVLGDACLYVNPYNTQQIAVALESLCTSDKLRVHLRERGTMRARKFSWEATAQKTLDLFNTFNKHD